MKVMVIVRATRSSEAGEMPSQQLLTDMGNFNEALVKAGRLLAGDGLHPSSKGARVRFTGKERLVIDGPANFAHQAGGELHRRLVPTAIEDEGHGTQTVHDVFRGPDCPHGGLL
ncbi:YCII-related domain-containing protein [Rhizobiales bacterium GAS188]|nr:YCII-related domain-containing protein [Rhizobiales bacterium GAS188]